jgi:hypothetical protein
MAADMDMDIDLDMELEEDLGVPEVELSVCCRTLHTVIIN